MLVLEKADEHWAGGNSGFTAGAIRMTHGGVDDLRDIPEADERHAVTELEPYTADDYRADLRRFTQGRGDEAMARILAEDSGPAVRWLRRADRHAHGGGRPLPGLYAAGAVYGRRAGTRRPSA